MICSKSAYPNERAARKALSAVAKLDAPQSRREVAVHPCRACKAWHLTSDAKALQWGSRNGRNWGPLPG